MQTLVRRDFIADRVDAAMVLTPHEDRHLALLQAGAAVQLTAIEGNRQAGGSVRSTVAASAAAGVRELVAALENRAA